MFLEYFWYSHIYGQFVVKAGTFWTKGPYIIVVTTFIKTILLNPTFQGAAAIVLMLTIFIQIHKFDLFVPVTMHENQLTFTMNIYGLQ